jgi:hypothetical protein
MRTGVSYMSHHNPRHIATDLRAMQEVQLDEIFVCCQENDFLWFPGKVKFTPQIAREHGIRPLIIFWGALNLFGGGRQSHFLLEQPECFQVRRDGSHWKEGCYVNPLSVRRIQEMIDVAAEAGYEGYFVDEPTPLRDCFCAACTARFDEWYQADLRSAPDEQVEAFRQRCVVDYVRTMADYCKANHPQLETFCCLMPHDDAMWEAAAQIASLDNLGTDIYWTNNDRDLADMAPIIERMAALCRAHGKTHHEWLECWRVQAGREERVRQQGEIMVRQRPDAFYIWAWEGQIGTKESCDNPDLAWSKAVEVLRLAKNLS